MTTLNELIVNRKKAIEWMNEMYNYYNKSYFDKIVLPFFEFEKCIGIFDTNKNKFIELNSDHHLTLSLLIEFSFKLQDLFTYFDSKNCYIIDEVYLEGDVNNYMYSIFNYKFGKHYDLLFDYIDDFGYDDRSKLTNDITDFYLDLMNKGIK